MRVVIVVVFPEPALARTLILAQGSYLTISICCLLSLIVLRGNLIDDDSISFIYRSLFISLILVCL